MPIILTIIAMFAMYFSIMANNNPPHEYSAKDQVAYNLLLAEIDREFPEKAKPVTLYKPATKKEREVAYAKLMVGIDPTE